VANAVALDGAGDAYVVGGTVSSDFPTVAAWQPANGGGGEDAFVTKLNASGSALVYSTYLGGSGGDQAAAVAVDGADNVYVGGSTQSSNFPTATPPGGYQGSGGGFGGAAFVAKLLDVGPLTYAPPSGSSHSLVLRRRGTALEVLDNNALVRSALLSNTTAVVISGPANTAVNLTIDNGFGGVIPVPITFTGGAGGKSSLTLTGTSAADAFLLSPAGAIVDGTESVSISNVASVTANGSANDSATLYDSPGDDTFVASPTMATLSGPGYALTASGFGSVTAISSAGGSDVASLYDGPGNDAFLASPRYGQMSGTGYQVTATGFPTIYGTAAAGGTDSATLDDNGGYASFVASPRSAALTGASYALVAQGFPTIFGGAFAAGDVASLYDGPGNDSLVSSLTSATLSGSGFSNSEGGFAALYAFSTSGNDSATLSDSVGGAAFVAAPRIGQLSGGGYTNVVSGFGAITAYGKSGGGDVASLYDSTGSDQFAAGLSSGAMYGNTFTNGAVGFAVLYGLSTAGGSDTAYLSDPIGGATFVAYPRSAYLQGSGYVNVVLGFPAITAQAGGGDAAYLHDSPGDDVFVSSPTANELRGSDGSYRLDAYRFSVVNAYSTTGNDVAVLYDAPGAANTFFGSQAYSSMSGAGYANVANNFFSVEAVTGAGSHDTATLVASQPGDVFVGSVSSASLYNAAAGYVLQAMSFAVVNALDPQQAGDMLFVTSSTSYAFMFFGYWVQQPQGAQPPPAPTHR
jgi:hypothetical protein